jgi:hypothetical protein
MDSNETRTCSGCGEAISAARLKELPFTTLCIGCKARHEKAPKGTQAVEQSEYLSAERDRKAELYWRRKSKDSKII